MIQERFAKESEMLYDEQHSHMEGRLQRRREKFMQQQRQIQLNGGDSGGGGSGGGGSGGGGSGSGGSGGGGSGNGSEGGSEGGGEGGEGGGGGSSSRRRSGNTLQHQSPRSARSNSIDDPFAGLEQFQEEQRRFERRQNQQPVLNQMDLSSSFMG